MVYARAVFRNIYLNRDTETLFSKRILSHISDVSQTVDGQALLQKCYHLAPPTGDLFTLTTLSFLSSPNLARYSPTIKVEEHLFK